MSESVSATNSIFGSDIVDVIEAQYALGIRQLDLKDHIFGCDVVELTDAEAEFVAQKAASLGMEIYCLSTRLFDDEVGKGPDHFARSHVARIDRAIHVATILKPTWIRLVASQVEARADGESLVEYLDNKAPWLIPMYREAIARIDKAGFATIIENEKGRSVLCDPDDVVALFGALDGAGALGFTWDVQNMWETSELPTLETYEKLRSRINYVHVKGGVMRPGERKLWKASLRDASWPVAEILRAVIADGTSPVICINPCHGEAPPGYDTLATARDDIRFVQELIGA